MSSVLIKRNMRLFGLPYQFLPEVDPRIPSISSTVGRKFAENIILDAPVITIIPGKPKYLPAAKSKQEKLLITQQALLASASDDFSVLKKLIGSDSNNGEAFRFYDFEKDYTEYIKYVNILCRACATFLELDEKIDGVPCQSYDYSKYKWNTDAAMGDTAAERVINSSTPSMSSWTRTLAQDSSTSIDVSLTDTTVSSNSNSHQMVYETTGTNEASTIDEMLANHNYVQFFIDADVSANESMSNGTGDSQIKGALDAGSNLLKEIAFAANSAGVDADAITEFTDSSMQALSDTIGNMGSGGLSGIFSRVFSLSGNIARGENIIMPEIYQNSSYDKSYSFTVHLKSPYGNKFAFFQNICIPLMFILGLGIPKQTSANTYGSPFLVKAYCEGLFTCNMGMVSNISIAKGVNNAFSVDGLPTEMDVQVEIKDLYSDLSMSPQSHPILFLNNSSMIEYLATTCGLSLITPNVNAKLNLIINTIKSSITDIDDNIMSKIYEEVDKFALQYLNLLG